MTSLMMLGNILTATTCADLTMGVMTFSSLKQLFYG